MWSSPQETVDFVAFAEEILNGKLPLLFSDSTNNALSFVTNSK